MPYSHHMRFRFKDEYPGAMSSRFCKSAKVAALWFFLNVDAAKSADKKTLIVLVVDGLRPDSIEPIVMPNLSRLKQEGVWFENAHSVFPTVTRVNAASISTGDGPSAHGIVSNTMWVEGVSSKPFNTADYQNLVKLAEISGGRTLALKTLGESLAGAGLNFVAIGSGSTGSTYLLNPQASAGTGALINPDFEEGRRVAFPDQVNQ